MLNNNTSFVGGVNIKQLKKKEILRSDFCENEIVMGIFRGIFFQVLFLIKACFSFILVVGVNELWKK